MTKEYVELPNVEAELIEQSSLEQLWKMYLTRIYANPDLEDKKIRKQIQIGYDIPIRIEEFISDIYKFDTKTCTMVHLGDKRRMIKLVDFLSERDLREAMIKIELYRFQKVTKVTKSIDIDKWAKLGGLENEP